MKCLLASILAISLISVVGCATIPKDALTLTPEALAQRQLQTRKYETQDEAKVLAACAGLLQDLGFNLDESETHLGLITASKERSAVSAGEQVTAVLVAVLTGVVTPTNKDQRMRACVVTRPLGEHGEYVAVRVTFQRVVRNTQGHITICESLIDPQIYQEFFDKLSKSIFLEAQGV